MVQFLRPDAIVSQGSWTGDHTAIDEATASDADRAYSQDNPNGSIFEVSLSNPGSSPGAGTTTVRYRHGQVKSGTLDGAGTATALDVAVYQGTTLIASDAQQAPGGAYATRAWSPNLSAVTDWNDVRLRFVATGGGGSPANRRGVAVSWAEIEVPDAPAGITGTMAAAESGGDGFAGSGTVAWPAISGTLVAAETGADGFSGAGSVAWPDLTGAMATSEAGVDAFSGNGSVAWPEIIGALAAIEVGSDTFSGSEGAVPALTQCQRRLSLSMNLGL